MSNETKGQNMTAIITAAIAAIPALVTSIGKLIEKARQSRELTDEQAAAYRAQLNSLFAQPHWQPDVVSTTTAPCVGDSCAPPACTGDDCKPLACTGPDCAAP